MTLPPFQRLLDDHAEGVFGFLASIVGRQEAEDCFQETFVAALRAYPGLEHGRNLRSWLLTIAHRKAIDNRRASARRPLPVAEPPEPAGRAAALNGDPAELRGDEDLRRLVQGLPPKQRGAVALRFGADLAYREIAARLGCSEPAARQNVREGLRRLRKEMGAA